MSLDAIGFKMARLHNYTHSSSKKTTGFRILITRINKDEQYPEYIQYLLINMHKSIMLRTTYVSPLRIITTRINKDYQFPEYNSLTQYFRFGLSLSNGTENGN